MTGRLILPGFTFRVKGEGHVVGVRLLHVKQIVPPRLARALQAPFRFVAHQEVADGGVAARAGGRPGIGTVIRLMPVFRRRP